MLFLRIVRICPTPPKSMVISCCWLLLLVNRLSLSLSWGINNYCMCTKSVLNMAQLSIKFCWMNYPCNLLTLLAQVYGLPALAMGLPSVYSLMFIFSFPQQLSILCHVVCASKEKIICWARFATSACVCYEANGGWLGNLLYKMLLIPRCFIHTPMSGIYNDERYPTALSAE